MGSAGQGFTPSAPNFSTLTARGTHNETSKNCGYRCFYLLANGGGASANGLGKFGINLGLVGWGLVGIELDIVLGSTVSGINQSHANNLGNANVENRAPGNRAEHGFRTPLRFSDEWRSLDYRRRP